MSAKNHINIVVIDIPHATALSEFTPLAEEECVSLHIQKELDKTKKPDLLIIPATKDSISDFLYLRKKGMLDTIRLFAKQNTVILGISGGFQMLGTKIIDIRGNELKASRCEGMGFLNIVTRLMPSFIKSNVKFLVLADILKTESELHKFFSGYEVHIGRTKYLNRSRPFLKIIKRDERDVEIYEGAINHRGNIFGTYIHGLFKNIDFRKCFLNYIKTYPYKIAIRQ